MYGENYFENRIWDAVYSSLYNFFDCLSKNLETGHKIKTRTKANFSYCNDHDVKFVFNKTGQPTFLQMPAILM
jgi:hypothetical protein